MVTWKWFTVQNLPATPRNNEIARCTLTWGKRIPKTVFWANVEKSVIHIKCETNIRKHPKHTFIYTYWTKFSGKHKWAYNFVKVRPAILSFRWSSLWGPKIPNFWSKPLPPSLPKDINLYPTFNWKVSLSSSSLGISHLTALPQATGSTLKAYLKQFRRVHGDNTQQQSLHETKGMVLNRINKERNKRNVRKRKFSAKSFIEFAEESKLPEFIPSDAEQRLKSIELSIRSGWNIVSPLKYSLCCEFVKEVLLLYSASIWISKCGKHKPESSVWFVCVMQIAVHITCYFAFWSVVDIGNLTVLKIFN